MRSTRRVSSGSLIATSRLRYSAGIVSGDEIRGVRAGRSWAGALWSSTSIQTAMIRSLPVWSQFGGDASLWSCGSKDTTTPRPTSPGFASRGMTQALLWARNPTWACGNLTQRQARSWVSSSGRRAGIYLPSSCGCFLRRRSRSRPDSNSGTGTRARATREPRPHPSGGSRTARQGRTEGVSEAPGQGLEARVRVAGSSVVEPGLAPVQGKRRERSPTRSG